MSGFHDQATLGQSQLFSMKNNAKIQIEITFPIGKGKLRGPSSCLVRPFYKLFQTGKPSGKINYIFYHHLDGNYYNFGSLCFTKGNRILFFPGFQPKNLLWLIDKNNNFKKLNYSDFYLDHFTLEKNLKTSHITVQLKSISDQKIHPISFPIYSPEENLKFWFGISIQYPSLLEATKNKYTFEFSAPSSDVHRRAEDIKEAREGAIFHILELSGADSFNSNEFLHFNVFLCPDNYSISKEHVFLSVPQKPSIVSGFKSKNLIPYRIHYVDLKGINKKITVLVSKHTGKLKNNILFAYYEGT